MSPFETGPSITPRILLLFVHPFPHRSKINRALLDGVKELPGVEVNDLYERYPDFHVDVDREQAMLRKMDLLVVQHPFYWYSAPPMLKQWQDAVLKYGFAFGQGGSALQGKGWLSVVTAGQSGASYSDKGHNRYSVAELLQPYECAANHCGMHYLEPLVLQGVHRLSDVELAGWADTYRRRISEYQPYRERRDG